MKSEQFLFPPFQLDIANECLWRGTGQVSLRRKTFAVLRYLVEHANRLYCPRVQSAVSYIEQEGHVILNGA